jgi:hypothetical protein
MATIPFALSIHHFVSSVGADAGFAAIIGLAILVLLFFSQARETSALRRRAEDAEDALEHLELRLNSLARSAAPAPAPAPAVAAPPAAARVARPGVTPAPASAAGPAPVGAMAAAGAGGLATIPAAPAGVGAPALSSATRLIPLGPGEEISIRPLQPGEESGQAEGDGADNPPANGNGNGMGAVRLDAAPPPSTAAGGAPRSAGASRPVAAAAAEGIGTGTRAASGGLPPRPAALPPRREAIPGPRQWRRGRVGIVLGFAVAVIAVVAVLVAVLGSSGSTPTSGAAHRSATRASTRRARRTTTTTARPVVPSSVQVAVLNGTSTPNLAHDVMAKLTSLGYRQAVTPATASNQTLTQTVVGYAATADRPQALAVARSLGLASAAVGPVSSSDRTVACSATPTSCPAQVFVTVGSDLSSLG